MNYTWGLPPHPSRMLACWKGMNQNPKPGFVPSLWIATWTSCDLLQCLVFSVDPEPLLTGYRVTEHPVALVAAVFENASSVSLWPARRGSTKPHDYPRKNGAGVFLQNDIFFFIADSKKPDCIGEGLILFVCWRSLPWEVDWERSKGRGMVGDWLSPFKEAWLPVEFPTHFLPLRCSQPTVWEMLLTTTGCFQPVFFPTLHFLLPLTLNQYAHLQQSFQRESPFYLGTRQLPSLACFICWFGRSVL